MIKSLIDCYNFCQTITRILLSPIFFKGTVKKTDWVIFSFVISITFNWYVKISRETSTSGIYSSNNRKNLVKNLCAIFELLVI